MGTIDKAREFAMAAHEGQRYDDAPYTVHLNRVYDVLLGYIGLANYLDGSFATLLDREALLSAAWLHDAVEDTPVEIGEVRTIFGDAVGDLVWAVTGIGKNRKERNANAYEKIVACGPLAAMLKCADRIANTEANSPHTHHREMYRKEYPGFETMILQAGAGNPHVSVLTEMLGRIRKNLGLN